MGHEVSRNVTKLREGKILLIPLKLNALLSFFPTTRALTNLNEL